VKTLKNEENELIDSNNHSEPFDTIGNEIIPSGLTEDERVLWIDSIMSLHPGFFTVDELNRKLDLVQESIHDDE